MKYKFQHPVPWGSSKICLAISSWKQFVALKDQPGDKNILKFTVMVTNYSLCFISCFLECICVFRVHFQSAKFEKFSDDKLEMGSAPVEKRNSGQSVLQWSSAFCKVLTVMIGKHRLSAKLMSSIGGVNP